MEQKPAGASLFFHTVGATEPAGAAVVHNPGSGGGVRRRTTRHCRDGSGPGRLDADRAWAGRRHRPAAAARGRADPVPGLPVPGQPAVAGALPGRLPHPHRAGLPAVRRVGGAAVRRGRRGAEPRHRPLVGRNRGRAARRDRPDDSQCASGRPAAGATGAPLVGDRGANPSQSGPGADPHRGIGARPPRVGRSAGRHRRPHPGDPASADDRPEAARGLGAAGAAPAALAHRADPGRRGRRGSVPVGASLPARRGAPARAAPGDPQSSRPDGRGEPVSRCPLPDVGRGRRTRRSSGAPDHRGVPGPAPGQRLVLAGETVLRFGWVDVATRPCAVAGQVGQVLRRGGWAGRPRPCGPRCGIADAA